MHSLATKLLLSFLAVVAVGVLAVAYLANRATDAQFESYVAAGGSAHQAQVAAALGAHYAMTDSWRGAGDLLTGLARSPHERLVLVDGQNKVVADTAGRWVGRDDADLGLSDPTPVVAEGRQVGEVYTLPMSINGTARGAGAGGPAAGSGQGRGWRWGLGGAGAGQSASRTPEDAFLASVGESLWIAALIAGGLSLALAFVITRQIVRPLRLLSLGAKRLAAGDLSHRVAVGSRDEVGQLALSFNAMAASLERDETARRNLLADIAHELRTPLAVIEGTADAILDGVYEPTVDNVRVVKEEAALLTKLIGDLRDLSLAETGQLALAREPVDLAELAGRVLQSHEVAAQGKGVLLALDAAPALPTVPADPIRLAQVVSNLVANALRHTPGGGHVTVSIRHDAAIGRLVVAVADDGEGIAPEDLPHVFDRFYRADKSRARRSGGSGLGLAIARQLVAAHGGHIEAESRPGRGATFTFDLPLSTLRA